MNDATKTPSDRELLEMAAKASGIIGHFANNGEDSPIFFNNPKTPGVWGSWNPLASDGDEARLEAALGLYVEWRLAHVDVDGCIELYIHHNGDKQAARRRAGTCAAAAIGAAK